MIQELKEPDMYLRHNYHDNFVGCVPHTKKRRMRNQTHPPETKLPGRNSPGWYHLCRVGCGNAGLLDKQLLKREQCLSNVAGFSHQSGH